MDIQPVECWTLQGKDIPYTFAHFDGVHAQFGPQ